MKDKLLVALKSAEKQARKEVPCRFRAIPEEEFQEYMKELERVKREFPQPPKRGFFDPGPK